MKLPVNPLEILNEGRKYLAERDANIAVALLIDPRAEDALISVANQVLTPHLSSAHLRVDVLGTGDQIHRTRFKKYSFVGLVVSDNPQHSEIDDLIRERVLAIKESQVPIALIAQQGNATQIAARYGVSVLDVVIATDLENLDQKLGEWAVDQLKEEKIAVSANYPFMREEIAKSYIKATSIQNAIVGGILFIPGADMPVMTLNQMKMIMQIAVVYDSKLDAQRLKELAFVLGGAFLSRTIARQLVGLVPGFGFAIKAAIGYSATYAMGFAALSYFMSGGKVSDFAAYLKEKSSEIGEKSKEIMADQKTKKLMSDLEKDQRKAGKLQARAEKKQPKALAAASSADELDEALGYEGALPAVIEEVTPAPVKRPSIRERVKRAPKRMRPELHVHHSYLSPNKANEPDAK